MKINYKNIPMELVEFNHQVSNDYIFFHFQHKGVKVALSKIKNGRWHFGLTEKPTPDICQGNELFFWNSRIEDRSKEGQELFEFLFKESPLRVLLLMEFGPDFYENHK